MKSGADVEVGTAGHRGDGQLEVSAGSGREHEGVGVPILCDDSLIIDSARGIKVDRGRRGVIRPVVVVTVIHEVVVLRDLV